MTVESGILFFEASSNDTALEDRSAPVEKYRVTLTMEERSALEQLVSKGKAAARKLTHARVLLRADDSRGGGMPR